MDPNTLLSRLPAGFALRPITEARYWEMLQIVPPLAHLPNVGFLVGEPFDHRSCGIGGDLRASYSVFLAPREGRGHYEGTHALTAPEWRALAMNPGAIAACIKRGAA